MADINLTSLPQVQPSQGVQQTPVVSQGSSSQTPQVPNQPVGTTLSGFIVNRDANGNPILRTDNGDFPFSTNFFLKIGSEVVIRFENHAGITQAHVLSINGQPPEIAVQQSAFSDEPDVIVSNALEQEATVLTTQAPILSAAKTATVSANLLPATITASPDAPAQQPVPLSLRILSVNPAPAATAVATPVPSQPVLPQGTQALAAAAYTRASGAPVIPPASQTTTQVADILPTLAPKQNADIPTIAPATNIPNATAPTVNIAQPSQPIANVQAQAITVPVSQTPQPAVNATATQTQEQPVTVSPAPAQAPPLTQGQIITATVLNNDSSGPLVQTPAGIVRLQPGLNLPPGSSVQIEVAQVGTTDNTSPTQAANQPQPTQAAPLTTLARHWDSLQQLVTLLANHAASDDPALQGNVAASINLPSLVATSNPSAGQAAINPQAISAGLMFFITALRGGDLRNWLGKNNTEWLEDQGHSDLLKRASAEFNSIAKQYMDTPPGQWRTLFFPIAVEGEWQQVRMFTKRDRKPPKNNISAAKANEDTRFVVEVTMSQMGDLQMDGLVQRHENKVQFDLYIRSLTPIHADAQKDILQIYNNIGQLTGYKGSLLFQAVKEFPVNPMEEVIAHAMKTVVA